jgi:hypothetical protein
MSSPFVFSLINADFLSPSIKQLPLLSTFLGVLIPLAIVKLFEHNSYYVQRRYLTYHVLTSLHLWFTAFFYYAGFFNAFYNLVFSNILKLSYIYNTKILDKGFLEFFGPTGFYKFFFFFSQIFKKKEDSLVIFFKIGLIYFFIILFLFFVLICDFFTMNFAIFFLFIIFINFFLI